MNYGDGWYGGVYVAAMYSLAFYSDDIPFVVTEALRTIPEESQFFQCVHDVIIWHSQFPDDWKRTWFEVEKKWSSDIGCPDGVFQPFNIDAKINAAYIVIGMLYGEGDFGKTIDISTRCGQDSDCNPASAGGILGAMMGYENIPGSWKQGLDKVEGMDFKYTTISLDDTYEMSFRQALGMISRNGGDTGSDELRIPLQEPEAVPFERAFEGHFPVKTINLGWGGKRLKAGGETEYVFDFEGKGFVVRGEATKADGSMKESDLEVEIYVDGELYEETLMPTAFTKRKHEVSWKYNMPLGQHKVKVVLKNPKKGYGLHMSSVLIYGPEPAV
jgi:hypothetical protein